MPLADELESAFNTYAQGHPWVRGFSLSPRSVVYGMVEEAITLSSIVSEYEITCSEGILLHYLVDIWCILWHIPPPEAANEEFWDIVERFDELVIRVDNSLVDEWTQMVDLSKSPDKEALKGAAFDDDES